MQAETAYNYEAAVPTDGSQTADEAFAANFEPSAGIRMCLNVARLASQGMQGKSAASGPPPFPETE